MAEVELTIAGRTYRSPAATAKKRICAPPARLVDAKSREALAGLGTLSESRQLLFAALLLADQIIDGREADLPTGPDPALVERADGSRRTARSACRRP